jgi:hypothetical protein
LYFFSMSRYSFLISAVEIWAYSLFIFYTSVVLFKGCYGQTLLLE